MIADADHFYFVNALGFVPVESLQNCAGLLEAPKLFFLAQEDAREDAMTALKQATFRRKLQRSTRNVHMTRMTDMLLDTVCGYNLRKP